MRVQLLFLPPEPRMRLNLQLELSDENPWLPHRQRSDDWAVRFLHNALQYVRDGLPPWRGVSPPNGTTVRLCHPVTREIRRVHLSSTCFLQEEHPWLDALVGLLADAQNKESEYTILLRLTDSQKESRFADTTHVPLPVAIPYGLALLKHPRGAGTRIIYSVRGV